MKQSKKQATQKTRAPKEEDRIDIPIPKRSDVMRVLKKAANPSRVSRSPK